MNDSGYTGKFIESMQCHVIRLAYDYVTSRGEAYFNDDSCCDMGGAIDLFTAMDEGVQFIQTYAGDKKDTAYRRKGNDWVAL